MNELLADTPMINVEGYINPALKYGRTDNLIASLSTNSYGAIPEALALILNFSQLSN
jgi:hypothetical protein